MQVSQCEAAMPAVGISLFHQCEAVMRAETQGCELPTLCRTKGMGASGSQGMGHSEAQQELRTSDFVSLRLWGV